MTYMPDAGGPTFQARKGLPVRDLRRVVDQGSNSGIHPALVVAGAHGHYGGLGLALIEEQLLPVRKISVIDEGEMWHDQIETIGKRFGVTKQDVIDMNRWFGGDASLNAAIPANGRTGLVDEAASQETTLAARGERSAYSTIASGASSKRVGPPRTRSRLRT